MRDQQGQKAKLMEGERELMTGLLSKGASFRLIVIGHVGEKEIERLIKKLELDKEILADASEDDEPAN
jgi:phosphoglycolate phosphatase-like HAD superfamily hydrolase